MLIDKMSFIKFLFLHSSMMTCNLEDAMYSIANVISSIKTARKKKKYFYYSCPMFQAPRPKLLGRGPRILSIPLKF